MDNIIDRPSGALFVDDGGAGGVPVLFIHAAAGNTGQWSHQLAHLRRTRRALALDLRGHGRSAPPSDGDYGVAGFAADVDAVADSLRLERFVLAGHSLGGAVAVSYAGAHPERVAGLFLLDPSSDGRLVPPEAAQGMLAALRSPAYAPTIEAYWAPMLEPSSAEVRERVLRDLRATPPATVAGALEGLLTFDPVTPLQRYAGPRLSVITLANETPGALHRLVPEVRSRKVEGTGHWVQLDAPVSVNALLDEFLT
jgi:pimeloyl-ACP methyl ester carboxylesterase